MRKKTTCIDLICPALFSQRRALYAAHQSMNLAKPSAADCTDRSVPTRGCDGISAAMFNQSHTRIHTVKAHPGYGELMGTPAEYTRQNVICSIKAGVHFITIFRNDDGTWRRGRLVNLVVVNGKEYLKTVDSGKEADELGNLPER
jgi:hypothetical protein